MTPSRLKLPLPLPPATLPCEECGGQCCRLASMLYREFKVIRRIYGIPRGAKVEKVGLGRAGTPRIVQVTTSEGVCPWLTGGRCGIYHHRPQTCREYGTRIDMPCEYLFPEAAEQRVAEINERMQATLEARDAS